MKLDFAAMSRDLRGYHNDVVATINDHCLRLAVFQGEFRWHCHPASDELFVVVEGELQVELETLAVTLGPGEACVVPAGAWHRTRAPLRTVNLCFERAAADTVFRDEQSR